MILKWDMPFITESSAFFRTSNDGPKSRDLYAEAHVHFGRFRVIQVTLIVTGHGQTNAKLREQTRLAICDLSTWVGEQMGYMKRNQEDQEICLTLYENGEHFGFMNVVGTEAFSFILSDH